MDCEQQMDMLVKIQEMQFVALELNLFLDTHPCDADALNDFNCAVELLRKHQKMYEDECGPLINFGVGGYAKGAWQWVEEPWPWQL